MRPSRKADASFPFALNRDAYGLELFHKVLGPCSMHSKRLVEFDGENHLLLKNYHAVFHREDFPASPVLTLQLIAPVEAIRTESSGEGWMQPDNAMQSAQAQIHSELDFSVLSKNPHSISPLFSEMPIKSGKAEGTWNCRLAPGKSMNLEAMLRGKLSQNSLWRFIQRFQRRMVGKSSSGWGCHPC